MTEIPSKERSRAERNRTITLTDEDRKRLRSSLKSLTENSAELPQGVACGDYKDWCSIIPEKSVDLLILDPPYNLDKEFKSRRFPKRNVDEYTEWLQEILNDLIPLLKPTSSIYICGDWLTSCSIYTVAEKSFIIRNRITWEREKGRGAKQNWKNSSEDIWFCTMSDEFTFNLDAVKIRRKVLAPYTDSAGLPKDWNHLRQGNYRDTCPSNFWTDITIPFWSMPENTDHPTQKSEKLIAKLILASTNPEDYILDPFLGSGTTAVVAKKLNRKYFGIELDKEYSLWALKRLEMAEEDPSIQGFRDGVFWERNSSPYSQRNTKSSELRLKE